MNFKIVTCVLMLAGLFSGNVFAGSVWLCAISSGVASYDDGTSGAPDLGGLKQPTFLRVDADAKTVTILAPEERRGEVSKADTVLQDGKQLILSGVERGRAWTLLIAEDGRMTLSITGDGVVWSVFGNAIVEKKDL